MQSSGYAGKKLHPDNCPPITHGAATSAARRNMACNYSFKTTNAYVKKCAGLRRIKKSQIVLRSSLLQVALVETTKKRIQGQSGIDAENPRN